MQNETFIHYKIKLTPLERFFFGGENVFGSESGHGKDKRRRSYLVKSNLLPQQTTLLGMLRHQLLLQNDLLLAKDSTQDQVQKAIELVGLQSFSPNNIAGQYGLIRGISPVVMENENGTIWQPIALDDRQMTDKEGHLNPLIFAVDEGSGKPFLENLNPKEDMDLEFGDTGEHRKNLSDCFSEHAQVGIRMTNREKHRNQDKDDLKEAYYRQTFRTNGASEFTNKKNDRFSFVFFVKMEARIATCKFTNQIVSMGGESSAFNMEIEQLTDGTTLSDCLLPVQYQHNVLSDALKNDFKRIVLLSDTYADWSIVRKHSAFVVSQTVPFRYFTTTLSEKTQYHDFKQGSKDAKNQSERFTLLKRGSVLYVSGDIALKALKDHLDAQKAFQHIGYNYYDQAI